MKAAKFRAILCCSAAILPICPAVAQSTTGSVEATVPQSAPGQNDAPISAQAVPANPTDDTAATPAASVNELVVTGSRIVRNGYDAPTPVSVVTAAEIQQAAPVTIADYVNQLPALAGSQTPRSSSSTIGGGLAGANLLNLRNLGPNRTLVLLNGRRVTPSTVTGAVDINTLPQALVQRVDVVTGGASAAWGSDAVSGVVNFILDTRFTGVKGQIQGAISNEGDGKAITADLSFGTKIGDRGHLVISGNFSSSGDAYLRKRDWYQGYKFFLNPAFAPGNGQPQRLILSNSSINATREGVINSGPLRGTAFAADGSVATTSFPFGPIASGFVQSGGTANYDMTLDVQQVLTPITQGAIFAHATYDLTDDISMFAEGSYGTSRTRTNSGYFWRVDNEPIRIDNAYLPDSVRARMVTAGITSFNLSHINPAFGWPEGENDRSLLRGLTGLDGTLGSWKWNVHYQFGQSRIRNAGINNLIPSRILAMTDAVVGPGGAIVCRSTLTAPTNGCVPYNPFGNREATDAQRAYASGTSLSRIRLTQHVVEASVQGSLFSLPAGDVAVALGADYRKDSGGVVYSDPLGTAGLWYVANQKPFTGSISVKEAFGEIAVPLLKDSGLGNADLNGAVRLTDYSTSGTVTTWKLGGTWAPFDGLEFRVTRSRDIRAPYLSELYTAGTTLVQFLTDPTRGNASSSVLQTASGNPNLRPERANSLTAGVVVRPSFLPGFSASIDYYDIKIEGAIATNSSQQIVNLCAAGNTLFCSAITRDTAGVITAVQVVPFNARQEVARGIDFELGYRTDLGGGTLDLRALVNYADRLAIINPTNIVTRVGEVGNNLGVSQGVPRIRSLLTATYATDPVTFQLKGRFIGKAKMEVDFGPLDQNINDVPAVMYLDAFASYDLKLGGGMSQVFFAVDNLLNKAPPVVVSQDTQIAQSSGTNLLIYDGVGRMFRAGIRFKY
ncbi:TonB-dependent receptor [Novosphingobium sp. ERN07]|uniref:TonB-dependent receptor domain-containing protein n=1 Tax=Novosphingobium sp. ERN07 TaxID=2726187 RepID=UPI0014569A31|nr:TonB-dependent receptor [Novosphingobium sp. ERN07]NLR73187.1 TonB-dependent receptor [Novosphingobium sp. ERN07]